MLTRLHHALLRSPLGEPIERLYRRWRPLSVGDRNARYDYEAGLMMARVLAPDSACIDIGAHEGNLLAMMREHAPAGRHWAFEPLPEQAARLRGRFPSVAVYEVALSDAGGPRTFQYAVENAGYSGFRAHTFPRGAEEPLKAITVQAARLDDLVPAATPIRLVKVDVEGAELEVLRGATALLAAQRPYVIFEHGHASAGFYGTQPEPVYDLLSDCGLAVSTMKRWLWGRPPLTRAAFAAQNETVENFYFLAYRPG